MSQLVLSQLLKRCDDHTGSRDSMFDNYELSRDCPGPKKSFAFFNDKGIFPSIHLIDKSMAQQRLKQPCSAMYL